MLIPCQFLCFIYEIILFEKNHPLEINTSYQIIITWTLEHASVHDH